MQIEDYFNSLAEKQKRIGISKISSVQVLTA